MDFLGIGPAELVMIVLLLLLFLGPTDVVELFRKLGRLVRKMRESPTWNVINSTAQTLRNLPNTLAEETGVEELRKDLQRSADTSRSIGKIPRAEDPSPPEASGDADISAWVTPPPGPSVVPPPSNIRTRQQVETAEPDSAPSGEPDRTPDPEPEETSDSE